MAKKGEGPNPKAAFGDKKTPLFLIPTIPLKMISWVMKDGAEKYGPFNWRKTKVNASTYILSLIHISEPTRPY